MAAHIVREPQHYVCVVALRSSFPTPDPDADYVDDAAPLHRIDSVLAHAIAAVEPGCLPTSPPAALPVDARSMRIHSPPRHLQQ